ncbi:unnamed protein product [Cryptosporidium hominis]|uniref:Uncharacterized protein n=1 Tax=Cryptosporidium hominis TaxID=237895 RepID=A0A0S4TEA8_CRYHO|nr:hypothetical protein ChTU502y2012_384g0015 [Cryptosporidium hominis]PPA65280.1 hypothetical protein ChUKH1_17370 [Cryptosporidium hominis]PPS92546.1 Uncharacterized protein GY17_00003959 [Cryptosporidium hominis]CUV04906.1 unnamed protein product [Cryptosporidium hominis]|eukprot:PPS92546.1 Uncharacterized protein GY17_00003959 [Cryptosporidium hominis]
METRFRAITCIIFLTIIRVLIFNAHVAACKDLHGNGKVTLKYPPYSGLEEESFQIIEEKSLGDYFAIGEKKLKSLFGIEGEDGIKIRVNEIEVERSELKHSISEFKLAEDEDIVIELFLKDELDLQYRSRRVKDQMDGFGEKGENNFSKQEGILFLSFSSMDNEELLSFSNVPKTVSVKEKLPMTVEELKKMIENFANPLEFSIESVTTVRNPEKELVTEIMNSTYQSKIADLENGDSIKVKIREITLDIRENNDEEMNYETNNFRKENLEISEGIQGNFPVMIVFSNRREVPNNVINLNEDSSVGDLLERLYEVKYPGTGNTVISSGDRIAIQNEQGREVDQINELELKEFVPEGINVSKNRPFLIYVTVFGSNNENIKEEEYNESSMRQDFSEIFEPRNGKEIEELMFNIEDQVKAIESDLEGIQDKKRGSDGPIVRFVNQEGNLEYEIKGDPSLITIASLYSQAQLVWNSRGNNERNCVLIYGNGDMILDPNNHETLSTLKGYFQGMKITMREPRKVNVEITAYLSIGKEMDNNQLDTKIAFTRNLKVPEIISVIDFLKIIYSNYNSELSKYLIVGIQKDIGNEKLTEYLPVPKTPSSITYLTFQSKGSDLNVLLEVIPAKSIEIMLMIPPNSAGEDLSEKTEDSDSNDESLLEFRLKILSNTTIRELIESLIENKVLDKSISPKTVQIKDKETNTYLNSDYIIGHHLSEKGNGRKKGLNKKIFVVEIIKMLNLNVMFYNYKGEELQIEPFKVNVKSNQSIKKLKEVIVSIGVKNGFSLNIAQIGLGSGFDIGKEFKKIVYTILKDSDQIQNSGFVPNDDLRVYVLKETQEEPENKEEFGNENQVKFENMESDQGPKLEIPLSIENCPLNTMLERRWFIVPMNLGLPIGELKELIDNIAMLRGMDFDLFGETEKGKMELSEESKSCLSLGITELGHLTAICNGKKSNRDSKKEELNKSVSQAIFDDICENDENSDKCSKPTGEVLDQISDYKKDREYTIFGESSDEEFSDEEIKEREERNRKSMELLEKIEKKIEQMEEEELKSKKNKKMMDKLIKKEALAYSKNNLKEKELVKLLRDFLSAYATKGTAGLARFCKKQGSDKIEQLVAYISTKEGRKMSRKLAKKIVEREKRRNRGKINSRRVIPTGRNLLLNVEYSVVPKIAQYSEFDEDSSSIYTSESESSNLSRSEDEESQSIHHVRNVSKKRKRSSKINDESLEKNYLNGDLDTVTNIQKSKKKSKIIKAFKKIPIISPTISFLYSRLSNRGKKKRKAKKYIKTIRKLEIQFRRKAYGHFQEKEYQQGNELSQDDDQFMYLLSY